MITLISVGGGVLFFFIHQNMLIISWSTFSQAPKYTSKITLSKKINIFFWKDEKLHKEELVLTWEQENGEKNIHNVISNWIAVLQDEKIITQQIRLESAALSQAQELFLCFNQSPLSQEWPIIKKWRLIESLGKTIRETKLPIRFIVFIVNDAIMNDDHLDFSQPWPIDGFIKEV